MTDQPGFFYAPAAGNNYVNTRIDTVVILQGGKTYLDTRTGTIMHGNCRRGDWVSKIKTKEWQNRRNHSGL
jgi:hypothetical protein